jgi:endogenous inhibitor of DNA gyrase (YacG/DUF329 family)
MIDLGKWAAEDYRVPADGKEEVARPEPFPDADLIE